MPSDIRDPGAELEQFRAYLHLLARLGLDRRLRGKVDLSGVVQDTFLDVHRQWEQFVILPESDRPAWLRTVLVHNLQDAVARLRTEKRQVAREISLEAALDASSARLLALLPAAEDSPSTKASFSENQLRLAWALEQLTEDRRSAVELYSLQGLTLQETADALGKSKAAVAQLVHRGIQDLHRLLDHE